MIEYLGLFDILFLHYNGASLLSEHITHSVQVMSIQLSSSILGKIPIYIRHKLWIEQPENYPTCLALKPYPKVILSN